RWLCLCDVFFFQAEDGIRDRNVTGVQTCALPICIILGEMLLTRAHSSVDKLKEFAILNKLSPGCTKSYWSTIGITSACPMTRFVVFNSFTAIILSTSDWYVLAMENEVSPLLTT